MLLAKAPSIAELVEHPVVLPILDALLLPNFLLSANLAINLHPGETEQAWHIDDGFYPVPRPRPAIGVSTIWAIDDFTRQNGATQVIVGSHRWGDERPPDYVPFVDVVMPAGSVVVFAGTLWHRGGADPLSAAASLPSRRSTASLGACPQEQMVLSVGHAATQYSERVRSMLGFAIHPPFMGHVDGLHPLRVLDVGYDAHTSNHRVVAAATLEHPFAT